MSSVAALQSHLDAEDAAAFQERFAGFIARAVQAWPDVAVGVDAFASYLRAALPAGQAGEAVLGSPHATDLYLACGAVLGQADAVGALDRSILSEVGLFIAHVDRAESFVDEVRQLVRTRLLVAEPGVMPKLADYSGRGALRGWVRVTAVRIALNLKRGAAAGGAAAGGAVMPDGESELLAVGDDPELAYFHALYRDELRSAFEAALADLSLDERNVLRLHYLDGLNIDKIGAAYQVHRATIARWLERSRSQLLAHTRRVLGERLGLQGDELASVIAMVQSKLDVSIRRYLMVAA